MPDIKQYCHFRVGSGSDMTLGQIMPTTALQGDPYPQSLERLQLQGWTVINTAIHVLPESYRGQPPQELFVFLLERTTFVPPP